MQTAVVAALNHGGDGSGTVCCKLSIGFHRTVSEQRMTTCSVSLLPQPISPVQTLTKSQPLKRSLVPVSHQMKAPPATVGYEVIFL